VRAFDRGDRGIFLEFYETAPATGSRRRVRLALGHSDREAAKAKADELAAAFRCAEKSRRAELTLAGLFETYLAEVTPSKGAGKRLHDARCAEMFLRHYGASRKPLTLARREWDRFIADRRAARVAPRQAKPGRTVRDRVVAYDLQWLVAVFNWATIAGDGRGGVLLERNPFKGFPLPREESPARPTLTAEQYQTLRDVAPQIHPLFDLLLVLAHETGHRASSLRHLRWSDVDLDRGNVRWRAGSDKIGLEHQTPLTPAAVEALAGARVKHPAIGDAWIFPASRRSEAPCPRHTLNKWWSRAERLAGLEGIPRLGYHSLRRQFATELKDAPLPDLCALGGWKSAQTVLTCYQRPDEGTQRRALAERRTLLASGLS
jgi:integrase